MQAIRYVTALHVTALHVTPLREDGSVPGIVEADDAAGYVVKFRAAGQGLKVLVAEVIVGPDRPRWYLNSTARPHP
jgi:hypothetical protein